VPTSSSLLLYSLGHGHVHFALALRSADLPDCRAAINLWEACFLQPRTETVAAEWHQLHTSPVEATAELGRFLALQAVHSRVRDFAAELQLLAGACETALLPSSLSLQIFTRELRMSYGSWSACWNSADGDVKARTARMFYQFDFPVSSSLGGSPSLTAAALGMGGQYFPTLCLPPNLRFPPCIATLEG
jgi:hypothetical protein